MHGVPPKKNSLFKLPQEYSNYVIYGTVPNNLQTIFLNKKLIGADTNCML